MINDRTKSFGRPSTPIIVALVLYLVLIPAFFHSNNYIIHVFILCSQLSVVSLTVRGIFVSGELTFGQVAFVMFGAYASAVLTTKAGMPFWFAMPLAGMLTAAFACLIGSPMLRLRGTYFAILTLILSEVLKYAAKAWDFVGGCKGFYDIPRPGAIQIGAFTLIPEFTPYDRMPYFYLVAFLLVITVLVFWRLEKSPPGRVLRSLKQNERLAASVGVSVMKYKILSFAVSAFFAGLIGSFAAHYMTVFYPESFTVWDSIHYVLYAFVGGIGYLGGPIVGTFMLTWLWEFLHATAGMQMVIFAITVIAVILFLPGGLFSLTEVPFVRTKYKQISAQIGRLLGSSYKRG